MMEVMPGESSTKEENTKECNAKLTYSIYTCFMKEMDVPENFQGVWMEANSRMDDMGSWGLSCGSGEL